MMSHPLRQNDVPGVRSQEPPEEQDSSGDLPGAFRWSQLVRDRSHVVVREGRLLLPVPSELAPLT
jgi:hypothetical protein